MRQRLLAILAIGVAVLLVYTLLFRMPPGSNTALIRVAATEATGSANAPAERSQEAVSPAAKAPAEGGKTVADEVIEWGSDPFVRDWILFNEVANLNLRAITVTSGGASALINDQILQVGDEISGKRIVSIEADKVTLEQGGRTFTLTLGE